MFVDLEKIELDWYFELNGSVDFTFSLPISNTEKRYYEILNFGTDGVVLLLDHCEVAVGPPAVERRMSEELFQEIVSDDFPRNLGELNRMFECWELATVNMLF